MRHNLRQTAVVVLALSLAGLVSDGRLSAEEGSSELSFFFPSDPEFIVIQYHYGYYDGTPPLRVTGDGTVRAYKRWASYSAAPTLEERVLIPAGTHTSQLSFDEINDLIRRLLDTGLLAFDEDLVQAQLREARRIEREETGIGHTTGDAGVHEICLRLQEIRLSPDAEPVKDFELRVHWRERDLDLDRAVELYPEIANLGQLLDAVSLLRDLHRETIESWSAEWSLPARVERVHPPMFRCRVENVGQVKVPSSKLMERCFGRALRTPVRLSQVVGTALEKTTALGGQNAR